MNDNLVEGHVPTIWWDAARRVYLWNCSCGKAVVGRHPHKQHHTKLSEATREWGAHVGITLLED